MRNFGLIILFLMLSTNLCAGNYLEDQEHKIIGKRLWIYFDNDECRVNLRIYKSILSSDTYSETYPQEVVVDRLVESFLTGDRYELHIQNQENTKAYIHFNELNQDRGAFKYLYFTESEPNLDLLKNACISNITPDVRNKIYLEAKLRFEEEQKKDLEASKLAFIEKARKKEEEKLRAESEQKKLEEENQKILTEMKEKTFSSLPETLKGYPVRDLCLLAGGHMREVNTFDRTDPRAKKFLLNEIKRRKIKIDSKMVDAKEIYLGMSTCELYMVEGEPKTENTSMGSWGINIQHVFSRFIAYSHNGVLDSLQY